MRGHRIYIYDRHGLNEINVESISSPNPSCLLAINPEMYGNRFSTTLNDIIKLILGELTLSMLFGYNEFMTTYKISTHERNTTHNAF